MVSRGWLWRGLVPLSCLLTFILMLKSYGWLVVHSFLTMNFEFDQNHGPRPGPKLDKNVVFVKVCYVKVSENTRSLYIYMPYSLSNGSEFNFKISQISMIQIQKLMSNQRTGKCIRICFISLRLVFIKLLYNNKMDANVSF